MWLLFLATASWSAKEKGGPAPAPTTQAPSMSDADRAKAFTPWAMALAAGDRAAAADALVALIDDPTKSSVHGEAWGHLGEMYAELGLDLAAIGAFGRALALDPAHSSPFTPKALALVEKTREPGLVAEALANNLAIQVPPEQKNAATVLAARYQLDRDGYGVALGILMTGNKSTPGFEEVELLRGITLAQQDRNNDALVPLLTAATLGVQNERSADWVNVANLDLARAFYAVGNYGQAIEYYAKVERSSNYWLDAQFERAWAHFRGDDVNGALAMLFTHRGVFFEDFFYPEADLLRAYSLFLMCKFPDATKEMDRFAAKYQPIQQELAGLTLTPTEAFEDVRAFREGQTTRVPAYVLRPFQYESRFSDATTAVKLAYDELSRVSNAPGRSADLAKELIITQRDTRVTREGQRVLARLDRAKADLVSMLEGIEITRLDLLSLEAQMYERAAATGTLDYGQQVGRLRELSRTKKGFHVWPWEGEYWADEVGWYVFNARPDCPESMSRGEN
jgi:tetratricopeptide (TPR) repeat protein